MIQHIWSVLCQKSVIDSTSNNLSLFDVFEELTVTVDANNPTLEGDFGKAINVPIKYEVVSLWIKEENVRVANGTMQIELIDPTGKKLKSFDHNFEIKEIHKRTRSRIKVTGIAVTVSGTYNFIVKLKESGKENFKTLVQIPLEVKILKKPSVKN